MLCDFLKRQCSSLHRFRQKQCSWSTATPEEVDLHYVLKKVVQSGIIMMVVCGMKFLSLYLIICRIHVHLYRVFPRFFFLIAGVTVSFVLVSFSCFLLFYLNT